MNGSSQSARPVESAAILRFSTEEIRQGLERARALKSGHWPDFSALKSVSNPAAQPVLQVGLKLKLSAVVCSPRENLAVINKHTMAERENCQFLTDEKKLVNVTCVRIGIGGVEVQVEGEAQPRTLVIAER